MDINQIITGVKKSPLEEDIKQQIIDKLLQDTEKIQKYIKRFPTGGPVGRAMNYQGDVATYIINQISDVLIKNSVSPENGRDTARHIYKELGGRNKVGFKV